MWKWGEDGALKVRWGGGGDYMRRGQVFILNLNMNGLPEYKPLARLYSVCLVKEVDSPRSERSLGNQLFPLPKSQQPITTQGSLDNITSQHTEDQQLEEDLEFSIDDLFSKIERIKSQFTLKEAAVRSPLKHTTSMRAEPLSYQKDWSHVLQESDQNILRERPNEKLRKVPSDFQTKIVIQDFELGKTLGSGKFGDVVQCRHKASGTLYALKKIFKSTIQEYRMVDQLAQELRIHYGLTHQNVVKLYCHFEDTYHIFLLMEYLDGATLMDIKNRDQPYISALVAQTLSGVEYLHRRHIAHRDIKPENLILTHGIVKICDFGWAATCDTGMKRTFCGTLDYVSPQILEEREYSMAVDLWSVGVLVFELLTGFAPFNEQIAKLKIHKIKNIDKEKVLFPPQVSPEAISFVSSLLRKDPDERMTLREAFEHPFIKRYYMVDPPNCCELQQSIQ